MVTRYKMARVFLTVMAAVAALCLANADPTPATTDGPRTFNLENITGKWWAYYRHGDDGPYDSCEMNIRRNTPEEIAAIIQSWPLRNQSWPFRITHEYPSESINYQNISFYGEIHSGKDSNSYQFLIEDLADPAHIRLYSRFGKIELLRVKFTNGKLTLRPDTTRGGHELNFFRTLPDLATYARCESFDSFDASDAFDDNSLVGNWTTNWTQARGYFSTLRVTRKTAEEISAYRENLRTTAVEEADVDWTKVRLHAELLSVRDEFKAFGLIEFLDKPGSIRVIPLKDTWVFFIAREVDNWFTSQNLLIKKDDELLAVMNCNKPWQKAYFSRNP